MSYIFFFFLLLIKYIKTESCTQTDCLSCNSLTSCKYENGLCAIDEISYSKSYFLRKLKTCKSDESSYSIMKKYCGNLDYEFKKKKIKIKLNKIDDKYGIPNLFCLYSIKNMNYEKKNFYIEIERNDLTNDLYIELMSSTKIYALDEIYDKNVVYKIPAYYEGLYLIYYTEFSYDKLPFEITIKDSNSDTISNIIIIICVIMIVVIVILIIILIILYKQKQREHLEYINRRNEERQKENQLLEKNKKIAKQFSDNLDFTTFDLIKDLAKNSSCMFCLCEFKNDDIVYMGKCNHVFHLDEIKKWFFSEGSVHNTCPECRYELKALKIRL